MEIKDLTKEQLNDFCLQFDCSLADFKPTFENKYYLKMFTGCHGPQPEFHIDETSCLGINYYKGYDLSKQWTEFLTNLESNQDLSK